MIRTSALVSAILLGACGTADDDGADAGRAPAGADAWAGARCGDPVPEGAQQAPEPPSYSGDRCPELTPGMALNRIETAGMERDFLLVVPDDPQPDETFPVLFMWHWLNASASSFEERAQMQQAVDEARIIAVMPNGIGAVPANFPWSTLTGADAMEREFVFFDDMLACVSEQFPVDRNCVSSTGVSDGALWTAQLAGGRGEYLSSILVLSGGTGAGIVRPYASPAHTMPALVLWGGPTDSCLVLQFEQASNDLETNLTADGHFLVECVHDCGHGEPPVEVEDGLSPYGPLWQFVDDHPYWLPDGQSPYAADGLPDNLPSWCAIGMGNAVPRDGDPGTCGDIGC